MRIEDESRLDALANIFSELREKGIKVDVDGQPAESFIRTLIVEQAESYTQHALREIIGVTVTPENLAKILSQQSKEG